MVNEGDLLWTPGESFARGTNMARYMEWLTDERVRHFVDYESLRRWSVRPTQRL